MSTTSKASQRIAALLDDNSFVEIGGLVTARATDFNMKPDETPSDGCITGYGVINGNLVYVYSQDLYEADAGFRRDPPDHGDPRELWRRTCPVPHTDRFYFHGREEREAVCQCA